MRNAKAAMGKCLAQQVRLDKVVPEPDFKIIGAHCGPRAICLQYWRSSQ